jgi:hypothetical protein
MKIVKWRIKEDYGCGGKIAEPYFWPYIYSDCHLCDNRHPNLSHGLK